MNKDLPEQFHYDEEIIGLTVEQLKKDFGSHAPDLPLSGKKEALFDELVFRLAGKLRNIHESNPILLKSLLYRIDVPENDVPDPLQSGFYEGLARVIIQREFSKVLTRRFFSGNQ